MEEEEGGKVIHHFEFHAVIVITSKRKEFQLPGEKGSGRHF